jgi:hypothetical protein
MTVWSISVAQGIEIRRKTLTYMFGTGAMTRAELQAALAAARADRELKGALRASVLEAFAVLIANPRKKSVVGTSDDVAGDQPDDKPKKSKKRTTSQPEA